MTTPFEEKTFVYVSSWLRKDCNGKASGGGIHLFKAERSNGSLLHVADYCEGIPIGYMCISPNGRHLYAVEETKRRSGTSLYGGNVMSFSINPLNGDLVGLNERPSLGVFPNHIAIDSIGSYLFVSNYGSEETIVQSSRSPNNKFSISEMYDESSVVVLPILQDGCLGEVCDLAKHEGRPSLVDKVLQTCPHVHSVSVENHDRFVLACDRGCDTIVLYRFVCAEGKLTVCDSFHVRRGTGPRTSVFHPVLPFFFVASELQPMVASYRYDPVSGKIHEINMIPTIPSNYRPKNPDDFKLCTHPSEIHISKDGANLYVSNRGHNSIARFAIDNSTGALSFVGIISTWGINPRAFNIAPSAEYMYVANQESDSIVAFKVHSHSGDLVATGFMAYVKCPVCIQVLELN